MVGAGMVALVEAANRYNPTLGVPFGAFARKRIQGAVIDELRAVDPLGRKERKSRPDFHPEVELDSLRPDKQIWYSTSPMPDSIVITQQLCERLPSVISLLPVRERYILSCYYEHELTQTEIGQRLGIHESRVSQIRSVALLKLREYLDGPRGRI